jgi:hypothetical protein
MFAATYPQRVSALVLYGTHACFRQTEETPWGWTNEMFDTARSVLLSSWGTGVGLNLFAPSREGDERFRQWWARVERLGASPEGGIANLEVEANTDIRDVLPAVRVPTLVIHRTGDRLVPVENGRRLAQRIPGTRLLEVPGEDHFPFVGDSDAILDEIEEFLTGARDHAWRDRVLVTVLFTDIVGSTQTAIEMGDRRWRELLDSYENLVARELARFRGTQVKMTGDGTLATFDGPARAIRCGCAIPGCRQAAAHGRPGGDSHWRGRTPRRRHRWDHGQHRGSHGFVGLC